MRPFLIEVVGWYGMGAVLLAYTFTTAAVISNVSGWFVFLNLTGALGLATVLWYKHNLQSVILNLVWAGIAIAGLLNVL